MSEVRHAIKDDRWHVLNRTGMYLGSTVQTKKLEYLIVDNQFKQVEVLYVPALVKMTNEIIDNAVDILKDETKGTIKVIMDSDKNLISVSDSGSGIPIKDIQNLDGSNILIPRACWSMAKSGSNFNDDEKDADTIGTNGVGSFCTNVLSTKFIGITNDGNKLYKGSWSNNCDPESYKESITEAKGNRGTIVEFNPDLEKLGIQKFDDDTMKVIHQRLINLSISYPNIKFYFNKKQIKMDFKQFMKLFGEYGNIYEDESGKYSYGVFPSTSGDFETFSIINGLNIKDGTHIDYLLKYVIQEIKDKLPKKYKIISTGDIKNKLKIIFIGRHFPKIQWEGQTKETLGNSNRDIRSYLGENWKELLPKVAKNKEIIGPITFLHEAKIDAEARKAAASLDKENRKRNVEKFKVASKQKIFFVLTEGDSADKGIIKALGREYFSFLPLKGVVLNVETNSLQKVIKNEEYQNIMNVLNLKFSDINSAKDMSHEYIVITTDADVDGSHIQGLLFGFFKKFIPDSFDLGKILILRTPIKVAKDKKENMVAAFLDEIEYQNFIEKNKDKYTIEYKKGLGSLSPKEYVEFFKLRPFEECLLKVEYTDDDLQKMNKWLSDDSDFRKDMIQARITEFNVDNI